MWICKSHGLKDLYVDTRNVLTLGEMISWVRERGGGGEGGREGLIAYFARKATLKS